MHRDSKRAIARAVAPVVRDGDVIAIDSSTSTYYLAQELLERRNLVVITNGLRHALLFMEHSTAMVLLPGGVVRRSAGSVVGPIGDVLAGRGRITAGFFGVVSVSTIHGLMDISAEEAHTKQFMAQACDTVYGLFDSSKVNGFGLHSFTPSTDITANVHRRRGHIGIRRPVAGSRCAADHGAGVGRRRTGRRDRCRRTESAPAAGPAATTCQPLTSLESSGDCIAFRTGESAPPFDPSTAVAGNPEPDHPCPHRFTPCPPDRVDIRSAPRPVPQEFTCVKVEDLQRLP